MTERGAGQNFPFHSLFWLSSGSRSGTRVEYSGGTFRISDLPPVRGMEKISPCPCPSQSVFLVSSFLLLFLINGGRLTK
jgi:hypothetical protein